MKIEHTVNVYMHTKDAEDLTRILNGIFFLQKRGDNIMTIISDFVAKQKAHNDKQSKAMDELVEDIKNLNDKIAELQSSAGQVTPEDQALLDDLDSQAQTVSDRLDALNALTPPKPPADSGAIQPDVPPTAEPNVEA